MTTPAKLIEVIQPEIFKGEDSNVAVLFCNEGSTRAFLKLWIAALLALPLAMVRGCMTSLAISSAIHISMVPREESRLLPKPINIRHLGSY